MKKYLPICKNTPHILHGGDYNPDQWLDYPEVFSEDVRLMKLAGINSASVAIFAWKSLEPEEGKYQFEWLDKTMDRLHKNGVSVMLATPSGARPAWMDRMYPEVMRTNADRVRILHGERHNHCYTSPVYREKVLEINTMLAERYRKHPALSLWHVSNEYGGECHCALCQAAFRDWLRQKYDNDIDMLNHEWWTGFWSHKYSSFDEIESPAPHGEHSIHGLNLDWKRFVTFKTIEFMKNEIAPLKKATPDIPVVTNLMGTYPGLDPWRVAQELDAVSWDNYPRWHTNTISMPDLASDIGFVHDINRSLKSGHPFLMMESTPSNVNWQDVNKLKRPGVHLLSSIQAVAHGSDSVQYFQWRKGRGACEKFHGAVVDHVGYENTRVFKEVASLGQILKKLDGVVGTSVAPSVALVYDWENRWAIDDLQGLNNQRRYEETCKEHYRAFWKRGIPVDVVNMDCDFTGRGYKLIVAPMLYMLRPGVSKQLAHFVENGGTLVATYLTGYVNENDLCFLGGFPGDDMMEVTGVWAEEIDPLYPTDRNSLVFSGELPGMATRYEAHTFCEIIHAQEGCRVLARYGGDFYQGMPALTANAYGKGQCYYIAARTGFDMLDDFYGAVLRSTGIRPVLDSLPDGVTVQCRSGDQERYIFIMNFTGERKVIPFTPGMMCEDLLNGGPVNDRVAIDGYGFSVLREYK